MVRSSVTKKLVSNNDPNGQKITQNRALLMYQGKMFILNNDVTNKKSVGSFRIIFPKMTTIVQSGHSGLKQPKEK
jgi:hypothetical protein